MGANTNHIAAPQPLPTLNDIERRARELLSYLAAHPGAAGPEPADFPYLPEIHEYPLPPEEPSPSFWPQLPEPAFYGLAGQVVRALEPHTEADPAGILLQFLAAFGNLLGPGPHATVASTRHGLNLFVILVGQSSKARKGTSWRQIARLFSEVDAPWLTARITNARITADGLIRAVRDQDPPTDRRLLILAEEFASILQPLSRNQAHLGPVLLSAWDHGHLRTLDRHHSLRATGSHITLIGHVTRHALAPFLHGTIAHNGFANRCLWACVRRCGCLPNGSDFPAAALAGPAAELRRVLAVSTSAAYPFQRSPAAQQLWDDGYLELSQGGFGLHGAATSRAEAQVLRLSAIYAALDGTNIIEQPHLEAALAVWDYCSAAAGMLFTNQPEDEVATTIRDAVMRSPNGISRDDIRKLFSGHVDSATIDAALAQLTAQGCISPSTASTGGRPRTTWEANPEPHQNFIEEDTLQD
jgi:hypothetical protein